MISLCTNTQQIFAAISSVKSSDYIKTVMRMYLDSYGTDYNFNEFYLQYNSEKVTSVVHRYNSYVYVIYDYTADLDELSAFISGFKDSVLFTDNLFYKNIQSFKKCYIMSKNGKFYCPDNNVKIISDSLKDVCSLVGKSMKISENMDFYLNINHQVRHKNLSVFALYVEDNIVSVSGVTKSYDGISAITFVYTDEYFRGNGYSKEVLSAVCSDAHTEYHLVCEEHNLEFYKKCGFSQVGVCCEVRL